jgi:ADP-dependent NAD(P)H-hydrate dehydratase
MPAGSRRKPDAPGEPRAIDAGLLRAWPLPEPDASGDKRDRGLVVCVGGAAELPGAIILAGTAALRAGAGGLRIGTLASIAQAVGVAVPEALVFGLPETRAGGIAASGARAIAERAGSARAVLIGPGVADPRATRGLVGGVLPRLRGPETVILDAGALDALRGRPEVVKACAARVVLTPHAGETARLLDVDLAEVERDPLTAAREAARRFGAVVAIKGADTRVVEPKGSAYVYREGRVGLATSGSGDTLAGVIAGLAARGVEAVQAAVWGVYLHGAAGNALSAQFGQVGFLARELLAEVPRAMASLAD